MPARSKAQQRLFGAELSRRRRGLRPRVKGISTADVREFASTKRAKLPVRKKRT